jgi:hypothetical protein
MGNGYPSNLPDTTPAAETPPAAAAAPQSTYDTLKNAGADADTKVDQMTGAKPIVRGTTNPDNALPAAAFHKGPRNFGDPSNYGRVRNTPI